VFTRIEYFLRSAPAVWKSWNPPPHSLPERCKWYWFFRIDISVKKTHQARRRSSWKKSVKKITLKKTCPFLL